MSKRVSINEFIERASLKHANKYDYSKVQYEKLTDKVTIICPEHGEFEQSASAHLHGKGCKECALDKVRNGKNSSKRKTTEQFIKEALEIHQNFYNYDKTIYTGRQNKVIITCPIHGDFEQRASDHLHGHGCSKCKSDKLKQIRDSKEEFIQKAIQAHGNKYDYSKVNYIDSQTKVCIICPKHGEFWQKPYSHVAGHGCSQCYNDSKFLSQEEFLHLAKLIHGDRYDYSKSNYIDTKTPLKIICPIHGEFWQTPNVHLSNKSGCPKCSISKGEELIINILNNNNIKFIYNYKINIDKNINSSGFAYIDFYLPDHNVFIEYNGKQHYIPIEYFGGELQLQKQKARDTYVKEYSINNNIKLIEIKYDMKDKDLEKMLKEILQLG